MTELPLLFIFIAAVMVVIQLVALRRRRQSAVDYFRDRRSLYSGHPDDDYGPHGYGQRGSAGPYGGDRGSGEYGAEGRSRQSGYGDPRNLPGAEPPRDPYGQDHHGRGPRPGMYEDGR